MFSNRAIELVKEIYKTQHTLPTYDDEAIREIISYINGITEQMQETLNNNRERLTTPFISTNIIVQHSIIGRNKRCILAYLMERLERIKQLRWELDEKIPDEILVNFSYQEGQFLNKYDKLLSEYMNSIQLDITEDNQIPPQNSFIEVRVLKDCEVIIEGETILLKVNTTHFIKRKYVEKLIRTGFLEHIA